MGWGGAGLFVGKYDFGERCKQINSAFKLLADMTNWLSMATSFVFHLVVCQCLCHWLCHFHCIFHCPCLCLCLCHVHFNVVQLSLWLIGPIGSKQSLPGLSLKWDLAVAFALHFSDVPEMERCGWNGVMCLKWSVVGEMELRSFPAKCKGLEGKIMVKI